MSIRLVLADLDGTLVDSMPFWAALPGAALQAAGLPLPADLEELIHTRPMWQIAGVFAARYPALGTEEMIFAAWRERMRENYACRVPLKPGAAELLEALRREGARVCLLTATDRELLAPLLRRLGLDTLLSGVVTEAEAGSKATAAPYALCMERFGAAPEETMLLEDSLTNLRAAAALGLRLCGVYDESMAPLWEEICALADATVKSLQERETVLRLARGR